MTKFEGCYLTNKGNELCAKLGSNNIVFTRAVTGDGEYTSKDEAKERTMLKKQRQEFNLASYQLQETIVNIIFYIRNIGLEEAYGLSEIGLYAKDDTGDEVLYCIAIALSDSEIETIPAYDGTLDYAAKINVSTVVSSDATVTINYNEEDHEWFISYLESQVGNVHIENGTLQQQVDDLETQVASGMYTMQEEVDRIAEQIDKQLATHTVKSDVPENAKFTDTTYDVATTQKDGLMSANDKSDMEDLLKSYIDNTLPTGTDFNSLVTEGRYYMYHTNTYTNKPPVSNGFVDVKAYDVLVKQIIWRQGTIGTNDHEIYERTGFLSTGTWSDWVKVLTTKDLTTTLTATTEGSILDATVAKVLNDRITAINTRLGTGNSSAYMTVNSNWSGTNVKSFEINQLHKVGKMVELDLALTFKIEQLAGVKSQIGNISSGILPRCEVSVLTNSFAPNATNPNGTASAELRIAIDGKVYWYNSTASSIPANGGMKAHAVWITN